MRIGKRDERQLGAHDRHGDRLAVSRGPTGSGETAGVVCLKCFGRPAGAAFCGCCERAVNMVMPGLILCWVIVTSVLRQ